MVKRPKLFSLYKQFSAYFYVSVQSDGQEPPQILIVSIVCAKECPNQLSAQLDLVFLCKTLQWETTHMCGLIHKPCVCTVGQNKKHSLPVHNISLPYPVHKTFTVFFQNDPHVNFDS